MSAYRFWEIVCDYRDGLDRECGEPADGASSYLRDTRKAARELGWVRGPYDSDYCPKHAEATEAGRG